MNSLLSVIVPVYNSEQYLHKCIESIIFQTYTDLEIILVNDGSTDKSGDICYKFAKLDHRIKVISCENQGVIKARSTGVHNSKGNFITFVDSDDWIDSNMYKELMNYAFEYGSDVVMSGIYRYYDADHMNADGNMLLEGHYNRADIEGRIIPYMLWSSKRNVWELDPSLWSKIYKRKIIEKYITAISNNNFYYGDDTAVIFPMMLEAQSVYITHNCYYYHRQKTVGEVPSYIKDDLFFDKTFEVYQYLRKVFHKSNYASYLEKPLDYFYMNSIQLKKMVYQEVREEQMGIFPFWNIEPGSRLIMYGAGEVGKAYVAQNKKYNFCNIVLWVDKNHKNLSVDYIKDPERIKEAEYDFVIIAVKYAELAKEIRNYLFALGVKTEKIIWNGTIIQKLQTEQWNLE